MFHEPDTNNHVFRAVLFRLLCLYLPPILSLCDQTTLSFYPIYLHLTDSLAKRVTIAEPTQQKVSLNDLGY